MIVRATGATTGTGIAVSTAAGMPASSSNLAALMSEAVNLAIAAANRSTAATATTSTISGSISSTAVVPRERLNTFRYSPHTSPGGTRSEATIAVSSATLAKSPAAAAQVSRSGSTSTRWDVRPGVIPKLKPPTAQTGVDPTAEPEPGRLTALPATPAQVLANRPPEVVAQHERLYQEMLRQRANQPLPIPRPAETGSQPAEPSDYFMWDNGQKIYFDPTTHRILNPLVGEPMRKMTPEERDAALEAERRLEGMRQSWQVGESTGRPVDAPQPGPMPIPDPLPGPPFPHVTVPTVTFESFRQAAGAPTLATSIATFAAITAAAALGGALIMGQTAAIAPALALAMTTRTTEPERTEPYLPMGAGLGMEFLKRMRTPEGRMQFQQITAQALTRRGVTPAAMAIATTQTTASESVNTVSVAIVAPPKPSVMDVPSDSDSEEGELQPEDGDRPDQPIVISPGAHRPETEPELMETSADLAEAIALSIVATQTDDTPGDLSAPLPTTTPLATLAPREIQSVDAATMNMPAMMMTSITGTQESGSTVTSRNPTPPARMGGSSGGAGEGDLGLLSINTQPIADQCQPPSSSGVDTSSFLIPQTPAAHGNRSKLADLVKEEDMTALQDLLASVEPDESTRRIYALARMAIRDAQAEVEHSSATGFHSTTLDSATSSTSVGSLKRVAHSPTLTPNKRRRQRTPPQNPELVKTTTLDWGLTMEEHLAAFNADDGSASPEAPDQSAYPGIDLGAGAGFSTGPEDLACRRIGAGVGSESTAGADPFASTRIRPGAGSESTAGPDPFAHTRGIGFGIGTGLGNSMRPATPTGRGQIAQATSTTPEVPTAIDLSNVSSPEVRRASADLLQNLAATSGPALAALGREPIPAAALARLEPAPAPVLQSPTVGQAKHQIRAPTGISAIDYTNTTVVDEAKLPIAIMRIIDETKATATASNLHVRIHVTGLDPRFFTGPAGCNAAGLVSTPVQYSIRQLFLLLSRLDPQCLAPLGDYRALRGRLLDALTALFSTERQPLIWLQEELSKPHSESASLGMDRVVRIHPVPSLPPGNYVTTLAGPWTQRFFTRHLNNRYEEWVRTVTNPLSPQLTWSAPTLATESMDEFYRILEGMNSTPNAAQLFRAVCEDPRGVMLEAEQASRSGRRLDMAPLPFLDDATQDLQLANFGSFVQRAVQERDGQVIGPDPLTCTGEEACGAILRAARLERPVGLLYLARLAAADGALVEPVAAYLQDVARCQAMPKGRDRDSLREKLQLTELEIDGGESLTMPAEDHLVFDPLVEDAPTRSRLDLSSPIVHNHVLALVVDVAAETFPPNPAAFDDDSDPPVADEQFQKRPALERPPEGMLQVLGFNLPPTGPPQVFRICLMDARGRRLVHTAVVPARRCHGLVRLDEIERRPRLTEIMPYILELMMMPDTIILTENVDELVRHLGLRLPASYFRDLSAVPATREYLARRMKATKVPTPAALPLLHLRHIDVASEFDSSLRSSMGWQPLKTQDISARARYLTELYELIREPVEDHYTAYRQLYAGLQVGRQNGLDLRGALDRYGRVPAAHVLRPIPPPVLPVGQYPLLRELQQDHTLHRERWPAPDISEYVQASLVSIQAMLARYQRPPLSWCHTPFRQNSYRDIPHGAYVFGRRPTREEALAEAADQARRNQGRARPIVPRNAQGLAMQTHGFHNQEVRSRATPGSIPTAAEGAVVTLTASRTVTLNARGETTTTETRAAHLYGASGTESAGGPSTGSTSSTDDDDDDNPTYLGTTDAPRRPRS